jgi:hypothetical protein
MDCGRPWSTVWISCLIDHACSLFLSPSSSFLLHSLLSVHILSIDPFQSMASQYSPPSDNSYESAEPQPHPYLHEPLLYISSLPHYVTDENLAVGFTTCAPFRPRIIRDGTDGMTKLLSGTIEFKLLDKGAHTQPHPTSDCRSPDFGTDRHAS